MREGAKLTSHCAIPPWPQAATVRTAAQNAQKSTQEPPSKRGALSGAVDDRGVEFATDDLAEHARGQHGGTATFALRISSARARLQGGSSAVSTLPLLDRWPGPTPLSAPSGAEAVLALSSGLNRYDPAASPGRCPRRVPRKRAPGHLP